MLETLEILQEFQSFINLFKGTVQSFVNTIDQKTDS